MALAQQPVVRGLLLLIYFIYNKTSQSFLKAQFLPAVSSVTVTYGLMASPYLTPAVKFTACRFGQVEISTQNSSLSDLLETNRQALARVNMRILPYG